MPAPRMVQPMAPPAALASALQEATAWLQGQASARLWMMVPAISTGIVPPPLSAMPPLGRGCGLLAMPAITPIRPWTLPMVSHPDPQGGTTTARPFSPPEQGPPSSAEQLASVVSDLEAQLQAGPGPLVAALPQQQPRTEEAVGLPGPATAPPDPTVTSKPTLLPGNIAEAPPIILAGSA